ncbi:MAG: hypothetical protein JW749_08780 [Sedimentisphaerales bacterium]|nr:hypothetical protein [Sedimentisphaerales bacterium]
MKYDENPEFLGFITREFDRTATGATTEELAEFAFGSLNKAIAAYKLWRKNELSNHNQPDN